MTCKDTVDIPQKPRPNGVLDSELYPGWTLRTICTAFVLTLTIFLALPFLELVSATQQDSSLVLYEADTAPPPSPSASQSAFSITKKAASAKQPFKPELLEASKAPETPKPHLELALLQPKLSFKPDSLISFQVEPSTQGIVFDISSLDKLPRPLLRPEPLYPSQARAQRLEGEVVLDFVVQSDGRVGRIMVLSSEPDNTFVDSAIQAITNWRFEPATKNGKAVNARVRQKLTFRLED